MARIRTIKPEFWKHEDLSELPPETHMLAAALLNYADDEGYFNANPKLVQAECCPLREDSTSVRRGIDELSKIGYIRLFAGSDGKQYGHVVTFSSHQRVDRPRGSVIKGLESSSKPPRKIDEPSLPEGNGMEEEQGKEGNREDALAALTKKFSLDFSSWPQMPSSQVINDWMSFRKKKRAPVNQTVISQMARELKLAVEHGFTTDQCLSVQQVAGWQGYKFDWHKNREAGNANSNGHSGSQKLSPSEAAWREFEAGTGGAADDYINAEYAEVDEAFEPDGRKSLQGLGIGHG